MTDRVLGARRLLLSALSTGAAVWLAAACADRVAGVDDGLVPLEMSAEQRRALASGLLFAARGEGGCAERAGTMSLTDALDRLVERIHQNDAEGARAALADARAALEEQRVAAGEDPIALMEVERMALALEHAARLVEQ